MSKDNAWPENSDLHELIRESAEHRRSWALVSGLARRLRYERDSGGPPSTASQNARIHELELRIVKQRKFLAQLEECRAFEAETERLIADALLHIESECSGKAVPIASAALRELARRKGPRETTTDE